MAKLLQTLVLVVLLVGAQALTSGCSSNREVVRPEQPRPPAQARIAVPIEDERPWYENAGEVAVIVVGAVVIIAGIVLPIILLSSSH